MQTISFSRKQRFGYGFQAGLLAGVLASLLMLLLSITINGISLPEVFGSFFTQILPPTAFDYLHLKIGGDAKHYLFYGILVGQCLVFALSGGLWALYNPEITRLVKLSKTTDSQEFLHWTTGLQLALLLLLLTGLVFLPLTGAGIFGADLTTGIVNNILSLAIVGLIFGLLFVYFQNDLVLRALRKQQREEIDESVEEAGITRRALVGTGILAVGLTTLGVIAFRFIASGGTSSSTAASQPNLLQLYKAKITPPPKPNYGTIQPVPGLSAEVTPNDQYYLVSKNLFSDPVVNGKTWNLTITGEVAQPYTLNYAQLSAMPMKKQYESMMCISNEVGGQYMSNALWEGIPLADLLQKAGGPKTGASKVVLYAADDYSDSIHLSKALEPTTLVALRMNSVTLPQGHGYPARLLVPGIYGMKHVKWITRIKVVNQDYQGYWQTRGWSDAAPIRLTSRIDTPYAGTTLQAGKQTYIAGVAFSGNKGISEVDVSLDRGQTWQRATLKQPLSALTWVLWELPWTPTAGIHTITVRAIDMQGNVQDPEMANSLPDGASGYHSITVSTS
jgi:DMSO/TMAO reductase YedYZ molybdopterin-dependent catalytic subunit